MRHTPIYRPILQKALAASWRHRELWLVGALAGLAGTGSIINDALTQARAARSLSEGGLLGIPAGATALASTLKDVLLAGPQAAVGGILLIAFGVAFLLLTIVASQQILLRAAHRAAINAKPLSAKEFLLDLAHPRFLRIFTLDVFFKLISFNLMVASAYLLITLNSPWPILDALFGAIFSASTLVAALVLNILCMISLITIARDDATVPQSLHQSWRIFSKHPFVYLEMSAMLFAINFVISLAYLAAALLLFAGSTPLFALALEAESVSLFYALSFALVLSGALLSIGFAGFTTTFTYSTWVELVIKAQKTKIVTRTVAHGKHFLTLFS
ncbi:hypothetical protein KBC55_00270 [Patescibacteria group bacterium]|nr:hypothetical protein [Patescibacteria group bacterium]